MAAARSRGSEREQRWSLQQLRTETLRARAARLEQRLGFVLPSSQPRPPPPTVSRNVGGEAVGVVLVDHKGRVGGEAGNSGREGSPSTSSHQSMMVEHEKQRLREQQDRQEQQRQRQEQQQIEKELLWDNSGGSGRRKRRAHRQIWATRMSAIDVVPSREVNTIASQLHELK